jgi:hypothetical protein
MFLETNGQPIRFPSKAEEPRQGTTEVSKQIALSSGTGVVWIHANDLRSVERKAFVTTLSRVNDLVKIYGVFTVG